MNINCECVCGSFSDLLRRRFSSSDVSGHKIHINGIRTALNGLIGKQRLMTVPEIHQARWINVLRGNPFNAPKLTDTRVENWLGRVRKENHFPIA